MSSWSTDTLLAKRGMRKSETRTSRTFFHLLDLGLLLVHGGAQQRKDDSSLRVHADRGNQHLAAALHHVSATEHHRIAVATFFHVVRFSGQ